jgi:hypothetical protein
MKKIVEVFKRIGSGFAVYFATLAGIALAQYAPKLLTHERIDTAFDWMRLGISMLVAFYLVVGQEEGGDEEGKRKHLKRRVANALAHGVAWSSILGIAGQAAGK